MSSDLLSIPAYEQYRIIHDIYVLLDDGDQRVLNNFRLTALQYGVLNLLDADEGQRLTTLSDQLLCARSTITRIIDQLERDGLVRRVGDAEDRRAQRVVLTPKGEAQRTQVRTLHEDSLERRLSILSLDEYQQLHWLLTKLRDGLRAQLDSDCYKGGSSRS
jgi:DNA-binding MarR family transcriptional regulator